MKQSKHNLHSTRYRTPYQSSHMASHDINSQMSPRWRQPQPKEFYSANELQEILLQQKQSHYHKQQQHPHKLICVCPGMDQQQNNMHLYSIAKRNSYLERKIESMRQIYEKQQERLDKLMVYNKNHSKCENNCYKDRYFELLKNVEPK